MVARSAGGREVAGSNPVTPIPWQGHGRRSDPSGGLRKRETVYCGFSFFFAEYFVQKSVVLKKERHRKTRQNQFMILPGFVTAETAGFEPVELKKKCRKNNGLRKTWSISWNTF